MTDIVIVSGFLGAGKTTLIEKLLREGFPEQRLALIENDFGQASVDATLLGSGGVRVKELRAGCICCSLAGNFAQALAELIAEYTPGTVLVEPSGVSKLSDVEQACADARLAGVARVAAKLTVVDAQRCRASLTCFGEFFSDQIRHAGAVVFSRTQDAGRVQEAERLIRELRADVPLFSQPWDRLPAQELLHAGRNGCVSRGHDHAAHNHAADVFETVTIRPAGRFTPQELYARAVRMEREQPGVLRAKGIVPGEKGYLLLQFVPGEITVTPSDTAGDAVDVIGTGLDGRALYELFGAHEGPAI